MRNKHNSTRHYCSLNLFFFIPLKYYGYKQNKNYIITHRMISSWNSLSKASLGSSFITGLFLIFLALFAYLKQSEKNDKPINIRNKTWISQLITTFLVAIYFYKRNYQQISPECSECFLIIVISWSNVGHHYSSSIASKRI